MFDIGMVNEKYFILNVDVKTATKNCLQDDDHLQEQEGIMLYNGDQL